MRAVTEIEVEQIFTRAKKDVASIVNEYKKDWMYVGRAGEWISGVLDEIKAELVDKCKECN